jgi:sugar/nucleoside kinase (ribokinase family)
MTLEYLRTQDIKEAVRYGNAAAAISVSRMGSSSSAPTAEEVRRLITMGNVR